MLECKITVLVRTTTLNWWMSKYNLIYDIFKSIP